MTPEKIKQLTPDGYGGDFEMTDTNQTGEGATGGRAMTNYNERLDETLDDFFTIGTERHISELKQAITSLTKELVAEAKRIAVEEVLDRFQKDCELNYTTWGNSERMLQVSGVLKRIEAERNKLKESK